MTKHIHIHIHKGKSKGAGWTFSRTTPQSFGKLANEVRANQNNYLS